MTITSAATGKHRANLDELAQWAARQRTAAALDERPRDAETCVAIMFHAQNARALLDLVTAPEPAPATEGVTGVTAAPGA